MSRHRHRYRAFVAVAVPEPDPFGDGNGHDRPVTVTLTCNGDAVGRYTNLFPFFTLIPNASRKLRTTSSLSRFRAVGPSPLSGSRAPAMVP